MPHDETSPTIASAGVRGGIRTNLGFIGLAVDLERLEEAFRAVLWDDEGERPSAPGTGPAADDRRPASFRTCDGPLPDDLAGLRAGDVRLA